MVEKSQTEGLSYFRDRAKLVDIAGYEIDDTTTGIDTVVVSGRYSTSANNDEWGTLGSQLTVGLSFYRDTTKLDNSAAGWIADNADATGDVKTVTISGSYTTYANIDEIGRAHV